MREGVLVSFVWVITSVIQRKRFETTWTDDLLRRVVQPDVIDPIFHDLKKTNVNHQLESVRVAEIIFLSKFLFGSGILFIFSVFVRKSI